MSEGSFDSLVGFTLGQDKHGLCLLNSINPYNAEIYFYTPWRPNGFLSIPDEYRDANSVYHFFVSGLLINFLYF